MNALKLRAIGVLCGITVATFTLSGCSNNLGPGSHTDAPGVTQAVVATLSGSMFYQQGYQIKMGITPKGAKAADILTFEVYVDGTGTGKGLLGYKDKVYTVHIQNDDVYVLMNAGAIVKLSDLDGHMVPGSSNLVSVQDIQEAGFTVADLKATALQYEDAVARYSGVYASSDLTHEKIAIASENVMSLSAFIDYSLTSGQGGFVDPTPGVSETLPIEKESVYLNDSLGVNIHGHVYSVGDYCNTRTYFEGLTPEGILSSVEYNEDRRVELQTVTYASSDGRTAFMTTDNYVQTVSTTCPFTWYKVSSSTTEKDLKYLLGISLSREEQESWTPMLPDITEVSYGSSGYVIKYGEKTVTLGIDRKTSLVNSIVIENYLAFLDKEGT